MQSIRRKNKKAPDPEEDPRLRVNFGAYAAVFPELVTDDGEGWLIRHVAQIVEFVEAHPSAVRKGVPEKIRQLKEGFRSQWAKKLRQMQVPIFAANTKGAWVLRFDDILADALALGPLKDQEISLTEEQLRYLRQRTPKGVPEEVSVLLYKFYLINRRDTGDYVLLPQQNFNAYFGSTNFSQKWVAALSGVLIERKVLDGVCKYRLL